MLARETIGGAMEDKARTLEAMDHDGLPPCAGAIVLRLGYSGEAYSGFAEQTQPGARSPESSGRRWKPSCAVRWTLPAPAVQTPACTRSASM